MAGQCHACTDFDIVLHFYFSWSTLINKQSEIMSRFPGRASCLYERSRSISTLYQQKKESVEVRVCCVPGDDLATDIGSPVDSTIALWLKSSVHLSEEMQELQNL